MSSIRRLPVASYKMCLINKFDQSVKFGLECDRRSSTTFAVVIF